MLFFVSFLLVFCSCFVPPFCYWFAPVMLQNRHPFGTVLVLYFVTILGASCEPLERVMDSFPPPHISRLPLGFSWVPLGLNASHSLCSSFVRFKLHHHQNHIKTSSKIACVLIAFQKIRTKILLVCMEGLCVVCGLPFSKSATLRGGYRKDRDCSRLFPLSVAAPRLVCRALVLSVLLDGVDIPLSHSPPGSTPGASKYHTAWLWLYRYTHIQRILGT